MMTMTFDEWCEQHGAYLNDPDDGAKAARLMALQAWQAAVAAERERCAQICDVARKAIWAYHEPAVLKTAEAVCENLAARILEAVCENLAARIRGTEA